MMSCQRFIYFLLLCLISVYSASIAEGDQRPLESVEVIKQLPKRNLAALPAGAPIPIMYYLPNAPAPSCGLVQSLDKGARITPIFETEPDQSFPYCMEVTDGAIFEFDATTNYVFRYRQRDTREDSSTGYFFVQLCSSGLCPLDKLNSETVPQGKPIQYVVGWAKKRLMSLNRAGEAVMTPAKPR